MKDVKEIGVQVKRVPLGDAERLDCGEVKLRNGGPSSARFWSEPWVPGCGLKNTCPANGAEPSAATPRVSGPMCAGSISTDHFPS